MDYKFDLSFKAIIYDCNAETKCAVIDLAIDKINWAHRGCGHVSDILMKRIEGKPNVTKGG